MKTLDPRLFTLAFVLLFTFVVLPDAFVRWEELVLNAIEADEDGLTVEDLPTLQGAFDRLQSEASALRQVKTSLLANAPKSTSNVMDLVLENVKSSRLHLVSFDPGRTGEKPGEGSALKVEVEGQFEALRSFLFELERAPIEIVVQKAELIEQPASRQLLLKVDAIVARGK